MTSTHCDVFIVLLRVGIPVDAVTFHSLDLSCSFHCNISSITHKIVAVCPFCHLNNSKDSSKNRT